MKTRSLGWLSAAIVLACSQRDVCRAQMPGTSMLWSIDSENRQHPQFTQYAPLVELVNTSPSASIVGVSLTVGSILHSFDAASALQYRRVDATGDLHARLESPPDPITGLPRTYKMEWSFAGFGPGDRFPFSFDIDFNLRPGESNVSYIGTFFNNGTYDTPPRPMPNARIEVTFADGTNLTKDVPDFRNPAPPLRVMLGSLACDDVIQVGPSARHMIFTNNGGTREGIEFTFQPKFNLTLNEAAWICGVDHFNFRQRVSMPKAHEVRVDGRVVKQAGVEMPVASATQGFLDPWPGNPDVHIIDPRVSAVGRHVGRKIMFDDNNESYYDDDWIQSAENLSHSVGTIKTESSLTFFDTPRVNAGYISLAGGRNGALRFTTELVGVDRNGRVVRTFRNVPNAVRNWWSDQTTAGGGIHLAALGDPELEGATGGGVYWVVPGDLNYDGVVNLADFSFLKIKFGQQGSIDEGDVNGDGEIGIADFGALKSNFDAVAVPEPSAAALASWIVFARILVRARRRLENRAGPIGD